MSCVTITPMIAALLGKGRLGARGIDRAESFETRWRKQLMHRMGASFDTTQHCYRKGNLSICYETAIYGPHEVIEEFFRRAKEEA